MPFLRLPSTLAPYCGGLRTVDIAGKTVREALNSLGEDSVIRIHLMTESGHIREHLHLFLGEEDVRDALDTPLRDGDELYVLQAMSGGAISEDSTSSPTGTRCRTAHRRLTPDEEGAARDTSELISTCSEGGRRDA